MKSRSLDITCIGEVLVDFISDHYDRSFMEDSFSPFMGGSPMNVAMNLTHLGHRAALIASVGEDPLGCALVARLKESGVVLKGLTRHAKHQTSMVLVTKSKESPQFMSYRQADYQMEGSPLIWELLRDSHILHCTTWPISKEPSRRLIREAIEIAREEGILVGLDPNFREVLWEEGLCGRKIVLDLLPFVDVIKPSEDDAYHLLGKMNEDQYVDTFLELGVQCVLLTLGERGCLVGTKDYRKHFPSRATEVVDTTGAGDAFWSGFYSGYRRGLPLEEQVRFGLMTSALALKQVGAVLPRSKLQTLRIF